MIIEKGKSVRVTAEPINDEPTTEELAEFFRSELKKKNKIQDIEL